MGTEAELQAYGLLLTNVAAFKYLGRILTATDKNWTAVVVNLRNARNKWAPMYRIIWQEGENQKTPVNIFKAVVQEVFLFG